MDPEETIDVAPSEDNGNVVVDAPESTPSEPTENPVVPTVEVKEPEQPTEPAVELFELPDGRKVDGATLTKEWKENFLPDYTRKSQELAKVKNPETNLTEQKPTNPLEDPNWVPQSYAEIAKVAKEQLRAELEAEDQQRADQQKAIEDTVISQLNEVKTLDPSVNENALFLHATKYGFNNLKAAHQNMKDMSELAKNVQKTTVQNIAKRQDPVSISPGASGAKLDPSQFETAAQYLRALKGQS